jgi:hypothetical protein
MSDVARIDQVTQCGLCGHDVGIAIASGVIDCCRLAGVYTPAGFFKENDRSRSPPRQA